MYLTPALNVRINSWRRNSVCRRSTLCTLIQYCSNSKVTNWINPFPWSWSSQKTRRFSSFPSNVFGYWSSKSREMRNFCPEQFNVTKFSNFYYFQENNLMLTFSLRIRFHWLEGVFSWGKSVGALFDDLHLAVWFNDVDYIIVWYLALILLQKLGHKPKKLTF